jgi:hypothetical protein
LAASFHFPRSRANAASFAAAIAGSMVLQAVSIETQKSTQV